eukprot:CAMPEP_0117475106 /NCGR_PEP_ID=MMETSP0784-20121206/9624_1 /TAXON_ID=39447 /ORGANISM="" /LENGTH=193 /DNA_ID=CAMNT_0005269343 /DNA_START=494 /DNA_END=1075 /DNA_ORIENTATION=+
MTGKQGVLGPTCSDNLETNIRDTAYGGGQLTLSQVGRRLEDTFCAAGQCFVGLVSAGDASGFDSQERRYFESLLGSSGAVLASTEWSGPSVYQHSPANCENMAVSSPLVVGCLDGTKQHAVESIARWLEVTQNVEIPLNRVWMFDDRSSNIDAFRGSGMNAHQISCGTRDSSIGFCGARTAEISDMIGVTTCN